MRPERADLLKKPELRLLGDTFILGIVGALSAQLFAWMLRECQHFFLIWIAGYQPPALPGEPGPAQQVIGPHGLWLVPIATTLGGLISGVLVYGLAPEAEGHGTDTAVKAFHRVAGFIRQRVAPLKMVASAITIGSGGAAGREGPTALISAGVGSIYATISRRTEDERRLLVLIGMAAGLSAIFRSPIGTAIFAVEVLYSDMEFEGGALLYTMLGSVVAYAINGLFVGWHPLFQVPSTLGSTAFADYGWYLLLGVASGLVSTALPNVFYRVRDAFQRIPCPPHFKPAIGALGVGLLALEWPQVLAGGYGWMQLAIDGKLALQLLAVLLFAKMLAFALTVSSGGSGGVFAPTLFIGAMLGGSFSVLFHKAPASFVIIGMAAVFGASARVPIATLLMVTEMTAGYQLLVPAALAVMCSFLVQVRLTSTLRYKSLYEAQVVSRAQSPAHYVDEVRSALTLIGRHQIPRRAKSIHLDVLALLQSGIPLDLPHQKQLSIATVSPGSRFAGQSIQASYFWMTQNDFEILAVFRQGEVLLPHPDTVLREGDRVLVVSSPQARGHLTGLAPAVPTAATDSKSHLT
jgi:chloride channel protein, CIC family